MNIAQSSGSPSPEETIKKLEAFQRCHGNYLNDPSLGGDFRVDNLIPHIRHCREFISDRFFQRLDELLATYSGSSVQAQFEQQLYECLDRNTATVSDLVEGLCSAITLQTPVYIELARSVLENPALSTSDFALISERFFNACAPFLAPGTSTPPDHFSHSFLSVALLAKSKQLREGSSE